MKHAKEQKHQPTRPAQSHQPFFGATVQREPFFKPSETVPVVQAKLTVGAVGDQYEQEADRVASQVVNQINSPSVQQGGDRSSVQRMGKEDDELQMKPLLQRETDPEEEDELQRSPLADQIQRVELPEDDELQMKSVLQREGELDDDEELQRSSLVQRVGAEGGEVSAEFESELNAARGGGQSLAPDLQTQMGQAMGADFSGVRVHTDGRADALNQSVEARAFTTGQDVFFKRGEYQPGSRGGQGLIAHELTHVLQQNGRAVRRSPPANVSYPQPVVQRIVTNISGGAMTEEQAKEGVESRLGKPLSNRQDALLKKLCKDQAQYTVVAAAKTVFQQNVDDNIFLNRAIELLAEAQMHLMKIKQTKGENTIKEVMEYTRSIREIIAIFFNYFLSTDPRTEDKSFIVLANASLERGEMALASDLDVGFAVGDGNIDNYFTIAETFKEVGEILSMAAQKAGYHEKALLMDGNLPMALTIKDFVEKCQFNMNVLNDMAPLTEVGTQDLSKQFEEASTKMKREGKEKIASTAGDMLFDQSLAPSKESLSLTPGTHFNVKTSFLRIITLASRDIATLLDIKATSTLERLYVLEGYGLPKDMASDLHTTLKFILNLRNTLHAHYGRENDEIHIKGSSGFLGMFSSSPKASSDVEPYYATAQQIELLRLAGKVVPKFREWATDKAKEIRADIVKKKDTGDIA